MLALKIVLSIIFWIAAFFIVWSMAGYNISLKIITKLKKPGSAKTTEYKYTVTVMIAVHNEEAIIQQKLENVIANDYPSDKIKYLVASDNSSDQTNQIVKKFIDKNKNLSIKLYTSKEHKGKTNAQNEAQELVDSDILVMTDANSMFAKNAITELVSSFSDDTILYVCGALKYINTNNLTADSESGYWNRELQIRLMESNIRTITAGNGAIYACRNAAYIKIPPIECHDSSMPYYYGKNGKRAIFNENAIAYEKAGERTEDEYKRKVRMNRVILMHVKNGFKVLNIFEYGWFSYFYFGHRTVRYLLWINHLIVLLSGIALAIVSGLFWKITLGLQILFYMVGFAGKYTNLKIIHMVYYYCVTVLSQWHGVINVINGKAKPTWESIVSTRQ